MVSWTIRNQHLKKPEAVLPPALKLRRLRLCWNSEFSTLICQPGSAKLLKPKQPSMELLLIYSYNIFILCSGVSFCCLHCTPREPHNLWKPTLALCRHLLYLNANSKSQWSFFLMATLWNIYCNYDVNRNWWTYARLIRISQLWIGWFLTLFSFFVIFKCKCILVLLSFEDQSILYNIRIDNTILKTLEIVVFIFFVWRAYPDDTQHDNHMRVGKQIGAKHADTNLNCKHYEEPTNLRFTRHICIWVQYASTHQQTVAQQT